MLKKMLEIDLTQPHNEINAEIDRKALSKDIAGLLKGDIIPDGDRYKWKVNLKVLANEGYEHITNYSLLGHEPGKWKKPVELIYGEKSNYFNEKSEEQIELYRQYYPQMTA